MIELGKTYQTRNGRPARLVAVDSTWAFGFVGAMRPCMWNAETGKASDRFSDLGGTDADLIEVKPKTVRTYWLTHYPEATYCYWQDDKPTDIAITGPHFVEFREGDGL
jgi:hypothetical protein